MTLLTIVQDAADIIGIPSPTTVVGNNDRQVRQLLSICNQEGRLLSTRCSWSALQKDGSLTTVATEIQGAMSTIAPDYRSRVPNTTWNNDQTWLLNGPLSPHDRQQQKSSAVSGPYYEWWEQGGNFHMFPIPQAGDDVAFQYISNWWVDSGPTPDGVGDAVKWTSDLDTSVLDEFILQLGLIWRFRKTKGLDYSEDFRTYETQVAEAIGRDGGGKRTLQLSSRRMRRPGIIVPDGNWTP